MAILTLEKVSKSFGINKLLDDLSFSVEEQTIFGFIGKNGAGKTTTMKLILGLIKKDSGTIRVNGKEVEYGQTTTNQEIGYLADVPVFYDYMTASEYLIFCGELTGMPKQRIKEKISELLSLVGLSNEKKRIKKLGELQEEMERYVLPIRELPGKERRKNIANKYKNNQKSSF